MHRRLSSRDLFFSAMASVVGRQLEQQQEEHPELQERAGSKTAEQGGMDQNQVGRGHSSAAMVTTQAHDACLLVAS